MMTKRLMMTAVFGVLPLLAVAPADGNERSGASAVGAAPVVEDAAVGEWAHCAPPPSLTREFVSFAETAAGAVQMAHCYTVDTWCDVTCGEALEIFWDMWQCRYDDDYDVEYDRYGGMWIQPTGWCCIAW